MKKNILIILFLTVALLFAFAFKSKAQERDKNVTFYELIADETKLIQDDGDKAKIECDNDKVFMALFKAHAQLFKRFTCTWKEDRHGKYKHYVIYLSKSDSEIIKSWASKNL